MGDRVDVRVFPFSHLMPTSTLISDTGDSIRYSAGSKNGVGSPKVCLQEYAFDELRFAEF